MLRRASVDAAYAPAASALQLLARNRCLYRSAKDLFLDILNSNTREQGENALNVNRQVTECAEDEQKTKLNGKSK